MDHSLFQADTKLFKALKEQCEITICNESCALFKQGAEPYGIYLVFDGEASLVLLSPSGQIVSSLQAGPGSVLGLPAAVAKVPYTLSAFARRGSVLGVVRLADFDNLLLREPSLYPPVLVILASELRAARTAFAAFGGNPLSFQSETRCRRTDESSFIA